MISKTPYVLGNPDSSEAQQAAVSRTWLNGMVRNAASFHFFCMTFFDKMRIFFWGEVEEVRRVGWTQQPLFHDRETVVVGVNRDPPPFLHLLHVGAVQGAQ